MEEFLATVTVQQAIKFIVGVIVVISAVVEFDKKIPFRPISYTIKGIGKLLNSDMYEKLDKIEEQQKANNEAIIELDKKVDRKFEEKQRDDDEKEAKRLRSNIIQFADSCRVGNHHTQNHFENIMRDYSDYTMYCNRHGIPNHFIDSEYRYIEDVYRECLQENKFL